MDFGIIKPFYIFNASFFEQLLQYVINAFMKWPQYVSLRNPWPHPMWIEGNPSYIVSYPYYQTLAWGQKRHKAGNISLFEADPQHMEFLMP
jgi:hypothetical protein